MNLLLDTHTLLWWLEDPDLLSKEARKAIRNGKNAAFVSAAVLWEIVIKKSLGKLEIPEDIEVILSAAHFDTLPVTAPHAFALQSLPDHHKDPFDRMLIAQAICEGFTLVTRDRMIRKYQVSCIVA